MRQTITDKKLIDIIRAGLSVSGIFSKNIVTRDPYYYCLPDIEIVDALRKLPPVPEYVANEFDCNAQADFVLGNLKAIVPGIAQVYIKGINKQKTKAHAWPAIIDDNFTIRHLRYEREGKNKLRARMVAREREWDNEFPRIEEVRA